MTLAALADALRASRGFAHKRDIAGVMQRLGTALPAAVKVGDDCAALRDGDGHLLFAIEGFVDDFVARLPWFAGYCGVMVNASDIYAMGGRPLAVVDALWSEGAAQGAPVLDGMAEASRRYGIPIVGGHSNHRSTRPQLAVAIVGRARTLLTSFDARPGDALVMAIDLRGQWHDPYPYWDASTRAPADRLRADLELLPAIAEDGLACAAKDISMAGALGTALMLLECSGCGAVIDPLAVPRPRGIADGDGGSGDGSDGGEGGSDGGDEEALRRWLTAFPSYGFVLSVAAPHVAAVLARFAAREIAAAVVGEVTAGSSVVLRRGAAVAPLWDFAAQPFITARARGAP